MNIEKPPILLLSEPGGGKSSGLKFFRPEVQARTLYINADDKPLPWMGKTQFVNHSLACPTRLPKIIRDADASGQFDVIIIDTLNAVMGRYASNFINSVKPKYAVNDKGEIITDRNYVSISEKKAGVIDSRGGYGYYAALVVDILAAAKAANAQLIIMGHLGNNADNAGVTKTKCSLLGSTGRDGIEAAFGIVMHAKSEELRKLQGEYAQANEWLGTTESKRLTKSRYVYQVEHTADTVDTHIIRSQEGLWPEDVTHVDNDLQAILDRIASLYA